MTESFKSLAEFKAIAMAATPTGTCNNPWPPRDHNTWRANQTFCDAMDAKTALALIAVAEAARHVVRSNGFDAALPDKMNALRAALDQLEGK